MRVPVYVHHRELEKICEADRDGYAICDDYEAEHEYTAGEIEFEYADLEDIVDEYLDDVIEILLRNHRSKLIEALKKAKSRKIESSKR